MSPSHEWQRIILKKTDGHCAYCGKPVNSKDEWEIEHVEPRSGGGSPGLSNLVAACRECNRRKYASNVERFRARIKSRAIKKCCDFMPELEWICRFIPDDYAQRILSDMADLLDYIQTAPVIFYMDGPEADNVPSDSH